jgi:hypothetical protein
MSSPAQTPNYLSEAIAIADGLIDIPVHKEHFKALLGVVSPVDVRHFVNGEKRCQGCHSWLKRNLLTECNSCPDSYCAECKADHEVYCK